jgi:DNA-binding transcriptional LysR family regulator
LIESENIMALTTSRMRALDAVLDEGSFSAAASRLGVSQPAVSQTIHDLERAFDVQLFERRGRSLVPTDLCLDLEPVISELRKLEERATHILRGGSNAASGKLRVGLGNSMPGMRLIGDFRKRFPKVQVEVELRNHAHITASVLDGSMDVGVLPNVIVDTRLRRKLCLKQGVVALIHPDHRLSGSQAVSLAQLATEPLIFRPKGSATQAVVDAAFRRAGLAPSPKILLDPSDAVYEAVANGLGIGFLFTHGSSRTDTVRRIPISDIDAAYEEILFCRADARNPAIEMFFLTANEVQFGAYAGA